MPSITWARGSMTSNRRCGAASWRRARWHCGLHRQCWMSTSRRVRQACNHGPTLHVPGHVQAVDRSPSWQAPITLQSAFPGVHSVHPRAMPRTPKRTTRHPVKPAEHEQHQCTSPRLRYSTASNRTWRHHDPPHERRCRVSRSPPTSIDDPWSSTTELSFGRAACPARVGQDFRLEWSPQAEGQLRLIAAAQGAQIELAVSTQRSKCARQMDRPKPVNRREALEPGNRRPLDSSFDAPTLNSAPAWAAVRRFAAQPPVARTAGR